MHYIITTAFLPLSYLVAVAVNDLSILMAVVGALGSTTISYILPGLCYYRLDPKSVKGYLALALCVAGCFIMPTALVVTFIE